MKRAYFFQTLCLIAVVGGGVGCRSHVKMAAQYQSMRPMIIEGNWQGAVEALDQARADGTYKKDDRVAYWLNRGTFLHYAGNYEASQQDFVQAEEAMRKLWTKSISNEAKKYISNETGGPYGGEDFEKVLVYYYTALNNVDMGKLSDAMVEARRADSLLRKMEVHYNKEGGPGTIYKQDAFMLWLVGVFYEMEGSYADAYQAYVASWKCYQGEYAKNFGVGAPSFLAEDIHRTGVLSGNGGNAPPGATKNTADALKNGMAEVILMHGAGESPTKRQKSISASMPDGYVMHVALPEFTRRPANVLQAEVELGGARIPTAPMEPVEVIAFKNYEHQIPGITARAIARATAKYLATKAAQAAGKAIGKSADKKNDATGELIGALFGIAANVAAAASEAADLRSWMALPAVINATRFWVPAGSHELKIRYRLRNGGYAAREDHLRVELQPGQRKIVSVRTVE